MIGKGLSNTRTKNSPDPCQGGRSYGRGQRQDPPMGGQLPAKSAASKRTRNSPSNRA